MLLPPYTLRRKGEKMEGKRVIDSAVVISDLMLPGQANPAGNVHGGEIMKLMDTAAGVTAMRHCRGNAVTLRVDELIFHQPIYVGELVMCSAKLVYVGKTSMEICVTVTVENIQKDTGPRTALTSFFTFVSLDENNRPKPCPPLITETEEEKAFFEEGRKRRENRANS